LANQLAVFERAGWSSAHLFVATLVSKYVDVRPPLFPAH
jgi:hypothetical protein